MDQVAFIEYALIAGFGRLDFIDLVCAVASFIFCLFLQLLELVSHS